jgi:chromosome segregation ATPase
LSRALELKAEDVATYLGLQNPLRGTDLIDTVKYARLSADEELKASRVELKEAKMEIVSLRKSNQELNFVR